MITRDLRTGQYNKLVRYLIQIDGIEKNGQNKVSAIFYNQNSKK